MTQQEKVKEVIELLKKGITVKRIAKEVHVSNSIVCLNNKRMKLRRKAEKEKSTTETI